MILPASLKPHGARPQTAHGKARLGFSGLRRGGGHRLFSMYKPITNAAAAGCRNIYVDLGDEHVTGYGRRLAAEGLAAEVRAENLLPQTR